MITEVEAFANMRHFDVSIGGEAFDVKSIHATETMSKVFSANVTVVSGRELKPENVLGKDGILTLIGRKKDRFFHGYISRFTRNERIDRFFIYTITISPYLKKQEYIRDIRIFQNMTTPDIIKQVLEDGGLTANYFEFRTHEKYSPREYCVQYRETNLEFIQRIAAEEGIFFYFEMTQENHLLVFGDMPVCHTPLQWGGELKYLPKGQLRDKIETVLSIDLTKRDGSGKASLADYHFKTPSYKPKSKREAETDQALEVYDYPGYITDDTTGERLARTTLTDLEKNKNTVDGESLCKRMMAGYSFTLYNHLHKAANIDYLLIEVTHTGSQPQALQELASDADSTTYSNHFKALPLDIVYRPDKPKEKPTVSGVQSAMVTGPEGEEIHVDKFGRVKVQFHWDRLGENNDKSSCWLRVTQSFAGNRWGSLFIPRIGQEVIVSFIDGDPDRPIITGAVYNGRNMPPYTLPDEKTKSTIKTNSSPGGDGFNELRFEDKKGEEEIYIHGEKDWDIEIKNDKTQHIGHDETLTVDNDRTKEIGHDQSETIGNDLTESIGNNKTMEVTKNHTETIGENMSITVGKNFDHQTADNSTVQVGKDSRTTIGDNASLSVGKDTLVELSGNLRTTVNKDVSGQVTKGIMVSSDKEIVFKSGSASLTLKNNGEIILNGGKITVKGSKDVIVKGSKIAEN